MAEIEAILSIFAENKTGGAFSDIEKTGNTVSNNLKQAFSSININNLKSQLDELLNETFTVNVNFNGANPNQNNGGTDGNSNEGHTANNDENNANNSNSERLNNVLNTVISVFIELSDVVSSLTIDFDEFQSNVESITLVSQDLQTTFQALIEYIRNVLNGNQNNNNRNRNNNNRDNRRNDENVRTENTSSNGSGQSSPSAEQFNQTAEAINDATDNANEYLKILNRIGTDGVKSISSLGESFRGIGQSLQGISSMIGKMVSIIGSSSLLQNFIDQASERQTNKMMLEAKSREPGSTIDADEYYTAINQKVIELPGNDQFLNQILTQIAVMEDYSTAEIEDMADIITNYYMLARAKGQTNFETEKEIRNYILTGNTKGLENSVLATEIKLLKEGNNVKERTILIEKAMQNIHMDGMAHYESYMNSMETFTGHFQKASADIGEFILAILTPIIRLYNAIDDLTFEGLSASILLVLSAVVGIIGGLTIVGTVLIQTANVVKNVGEAYKTLSALIMVTNDLSIAQTLYLSFLGTAYGKANAQIALNTAIEEGSISAKIIDKAVTFLLGEAVMYEAGTVMYGSVVLEQDILIRERGIITRISETLHRIWNSVAVYEETVAVGINTEATANEVIAKNLDVEATIKSIVVHLKDAISRRLSSNATLRQIITKLRKIAIQTWEVIQTGALAIAEQILVAVKGEEAVANTVLAGSTLELAGAVEALKITLGPIGAIFDIIGLSMYAIIAIIGAIVGGFLLLTNAGGSLDFLKGIFNDIWGGLNRIWEAFMNSEPVQDIITTFQNFAYTLEALFNFIGSIGGGLWELVFGVDNGSEGGGFDILGLLLEIIGAIGNFLYWLSPLEEILSIFDAIGSAIAWVLETWNDFVDSAEMQSLIKAFQDVRVIFGEAFGELWDAFGELWDVLSEIGEAFGSIFSDDESTEKAKDDVNVLLELLKALATIIETVVIPPLKAVADTIKAIADAVKWVSDGVEWLMGSGEDATQKPQNIANTTGGYNMINGMGGYDYSKAQGMAQSYNYSNAQQTSSIVNYFGEGSVQADARNMSAKDVQTLFTGAFGYNKARGTQGILG